MLIMLQILFNERLRDNQTLFGWLRKLVNTWAQPVYNLPVLPEGPVLHPLCLQCRLSAVCQWQPETPGSSAVFCQSPVQIEYSVQDFSVSSRPKNNDNVISIYSNNAYNTFVSTHFFFPKNSGKESDTGLLTCAHPPFCRTNCASFCHPFGFLNTQKETNNTQIPQASSKKRRIPKNECVNWGFLFRAQDDKAASSNHPDSAAFLRQRGPPDLII